MNKSEHQALVAKCRASGMTAKAWCETNGIDYRLYLAWATKVNSEGRDSPQQWVDVTLIKESHKTTSEIPKVERI